MIYCTTFHDLHHHDLCEDYINYSFRFIRHFEDYYVLAPSFRSAFTFKLSVFLSCTVWLCNNMIYGT